MDLWLPDLNLFLVLAPIVFLGCFVFVTIGFGGGVVAVPLAALFLDPLDLLPILALTETFTVVRMARLDRRNIVWGDALRVMSTAVLGTIAGTALLVNLPVRWLMIGLAAFIAVFVITRFVGNKERKAIARGWAWPVGALAGICSGAFGAGGPPTAMFLNMRRHSVVRARSTIAATGAANLLFRVTAFALAGLYAKPSLLVTAAWLIPVAYLSIKIAEQIRHRISDQRILTATFVMLGLSAVTLFLRALAMP